jgi:hypothetical protein
MDFGKLKPTKMRNLKQIHEVWILGFTVYVSIFCHGVDLLVGQNLHMLPAGSAVKLIGPN